jgi:predicted O-methyltransferase YrrM
VSDVGLGYILKHPDRFMGALVTDPVGLWDTFRDRLAQAQEYASRPPYRTDADPGWEAHLYDLLGRMPRNTTGEFRALWHDVLAEARAHGINVGPASYAGWNDGDTALVRAIWRLVREMQPERVVETGVGHGFTSRVILEALQRSSKGHLWSIDRPPLDPAVRNRIGVVVGSHHHNRWTLIQKSSRRALPALTRHLGSIDLFIHDSGHTERNVSFEMKHAWKALRPGGVAVIDDIDSNWGFDAFTKSHRDFRALVCEAEPLRPDERRFNRKGLFAIITKTI